MTQKHVLGGALLVAGTSIGAGMLALPVLTGVGGFGPAVFVCLLCWLFMTCTGLLLLEICLRLPPGANLISMATTYLGKPGKFLAWGLYLFLFYCLSIAYVSCGGGILSKWLGISSLAASGTLFVMLLAPFVYLGTKLVDRINIFLMAGLIGSYLLFIIFGLPHVKFDLLTEARLAPALLALPIIFTSFSYQGIIPSLTTYMNRDPQKIRQAILLGTTMTLAVYLIWEFLILGIIPIEGLEFARHHNQNAVQPLRDYVPYGTIVLAGDLFSFLAVATSYLGVTLGLFDFLADGLKMAKKGKQRAFLAALTFLPPLIISLARPGLFLTALKYAGGIGCAILLGLIPTLMVWQSRRRKEGGPRMLPGGKLVLSILILFIVFEVVMEVFSELSRYNN